MSKMQVGERLRILLDDGEPIDNVPRSVKTEGHENFIPGKDRRLLVGLIKTINKSIKLIRFMGKKNPDRLGKSFFAAIHVLC